eukprot:scaffold272_cov112-Isochrysis_galbana.AAC.3
MQHAARYPVVPQSPPDERVISVAVSSDAASSEQQDLSLESGFCRTELCCRRLPRRRRRALAPAQWANVWSATCC